MRSKQIRFLFSIGASIAVAMVAAPAFCQTVVVDDNAAVDGTGALDAQYFYSSSSQGLEINANSIGLVSGGSGRPIHGIFPAVTLSEVGDTITLSFTFMTPDSVGNDEDNGFRFGLFDTLGRETPVLDENGDPVLDENGDPLTEGVFGNILASSNPATGPGPNPIYGVPGSGGSTPETQALPGFTTAYDVNDIVGGSFGDDEVQIRQADITSPSGRFLTTTSGFDILADVNAEEDPVGSGNQVLGWAPNSMYTGFMEIERISETELLISTFIDNLVGFPQPDMATDPVVVQTRTTPNPSPPTPVRRRDLPAVADSFTFDMFSFAASSGAFGTSNSPETADNGIDFLSIQIETTGDVEETSVVGDFDGDGDVDCDDLDGYIGNIDLPATTQTAPLDLDTDGTISAADANSLITTLLVTSNGVTGSFPGDLNCDGAVDVLGDAFILVANLGSSVNSYSLGDINFDGNVDVLGDAFALVANLGSSNE